MVDLLFEIKTIVSKYVSFLKIIFIYWLLATYAFGTMTYLKINFNIVSLFTNIVSSNRSKVLT